MKTSLRLRKMHGLKKVNGAKVSVLQNSLVHKYTSTHHTAARRKAGRSKAN